MTTAVRHSVADVDRSVSLEDEKEKTVGRSHFMAATWHLDPKNHSISRPLRWIAWNAMYHGDTTPKTGKVGVFGVLEQHSILLPRVLIPIAAQYLSMKYFNFQWPPLMAYTIYSLWNIVIFRTSMPNFDRLIQKHGYLDGNVPRDIIPDSKFNNTMLFIFLTLLLRPMLSVMLAYDQAQMPFISLWLPVHGFIYSIILDFFFYCYHRSVHEVDWLWRFHKTHHMTKHPSPLLSAFADPEQDFLEILVIPLLTWACYPVDFWSWYIITNYQMWIEAAGHAGIRVQWRSPFSYPILNWFDMEIDTEDHDLHHRQGWRKSYNYGKQTRVWDTLFGTKRDRIELRKENLE